MIEDFYSFKLTDTLDANTMGMFASQLHTVDLISRNIQTYDYDYFSEFDKMDHLNSIPLYKSLSDTSDSSQGNQYFNYVDNGMVEANDKNEMIYKKYIFKNFKESINFTNKVGILSEEEGHHPDISLGWVYCLIMIHTHAIKGLSLNDFILASKIDQI